MIWETLPGWCGPAEGATPDQYGPDGVHLDVALLQRAASNIGNTAMVEIGSWAGRSAFVLHEAATYVPLHCFDPYTKGLVEDGAFGISSEKAKQLFLGAITKCCERAAQTKPGVLPERVVTHPGIFLHVLDSVAGGAAWDGPAVGLLHVDGLHTEEQVRRELTAWLPHLAPKAVVIFDDWLSYDGAIQRGCWAVLHCAEWEVRTRGYGRFLVGRR